MLSPHYSPANQQGGWYPAQRLSQRWHAEQIRLSPTNLEAAIQAPYTSAGTESDNSQHGLRPSRAANQQFINLVTGEDAAQQDVDTWYPAECMDSASGEDAALQNGRSDT